MSSIGAAPRAASLSPARAAASRRNGARSRGPKTAQGLWSDLVDEGVGGVSSVMVEITDGRIRHGGGYRRWTATARQDGRSAAHDDLVDDRGRRRLVRNGHAPSRAIQTGIGPIEARRPRVHDRGAGDAPRIRFTSAVLPAYLRRARNVEELLPWLYLKGISTGQFEDALTALLGPDAPGLSPTTIRRLAGARSLHQTLRLRLGRRGLLHAAPRA